MLVTMITSEQETMAFPVPLDGFNKVYDGAPVDNVLYEQSRRKMMDQFTQRQKTASLEPETLFPGVEGKALAAQIAATRASRSAGAAAEPKAAAPSDGNSAWVKLCMNNEPSSNQQICYVHHEGLEPKTGMVLVTAQVRTTDGEEKQQLLVGLPTAYSLVMPAGVQIKIDEGKPIELQYANCFPTSCQVQMELTKELLKKMREGKQMVVAATNMQQKTMAFPVPLNGFSNAYDGAPMDNVQYDDARRKLMEQFRQRQAKSGR